MASTTVKPAPKATLPEAIAKAQEAATKAAAAPAPAPATTETEKGKGKDKPPREKQQEVFDTADAALKSATDRTKGPRRAFTCTADDGTEVHVVANNEGRAGGIAWMKLGGKVQELGSKATRSKPLGVDGILSAVNSLPEAERAAVLAQLKALKG